MKNIKYDGKTNVYELNNHIDWLSTQQLYEMLREDFGDECVGRHVWIVDDLGINIAGILDCAYVDDYYQLVGIYSGNPDQYFREEDYGKTWMVYVD